MIIGVHVYLKMNGNGQEAVEFYRDVFEAEVVGVRTFDELPENPAFTIPEEAKNRVLHAHLNIGNTELLLSDTFPGQTVEAGTNMDACVTLQNAEKAKEVFEKLQADGEILMPLAPTDWSPAYGQVKDKFGITWQISTNS